MNQKFDFDLNDLKLQLVEAQEATGKKKRLELAFQTKLRSVKDENSRLREQINEKKLSEVNCKQVQGELNILQHELELIVEEKLVFIIILLLYLQLTLLSSIFNTVNPCL